MISVDNFYWVIWDQLLQPHDMSESHFYPFGSTSVTDIISRHYRRPGDVGDGESLFDWGKGGTLVWFYDQEPLNTVRLNDGMLRSLGHRWFKQARILANSEISAEKKQFVKNNDLLDWYYFYHGFAALDWFRDAQYITTEYAIKHNYISLNHLITGDRSYRMALTARLLTEKLDQHGLISFHHQGNDCLTEINSQESNLGVLDKLLVKRSLPQLSAGLYVDKLTGFGELSALFGYDDYRLWQSALLHVVNETVFYHEKLHLTEKIFKPIVASRPFVLAAAPGNLAYLRSYGFQTFEPWIDESYDQETNHTRRLNMIAAEISKFAKMTPQELQRTYQSMQEVLVHNRQHFYGKFKEIIIDEMIQNFQGCVAQWNNGRVDDRGIESHLDFAAVKARLMS